MGRFGSYDQAGNVKEWCWNAVAGDPSRRYILGGGWGEPEYMAAEPDMQDAFRRDPNFGIRCSRYIGDELPEPSLYDPVQAPYRDYSLEKPASDEQFEVYRRFYAYDPTPLKEVLEHADEGHEFWRREIVSFDAAYGSERVSAHLLLPKNADPPYQTVVVFPAVDVFLRRTSEDIHSGYTGFFTRFLPRTGRAVVHPIIAGSYERNEGNAIPAPGPTIAARDLQVMWYRDLARTMDYLVTRSDIDPGRIAYFGLSLGGAVGPVMLALEPRF